MSRRVRDLSSTIGEVADVWRREPDPAPDPSVPVRMMCALCPPDDRWSREGPLEHVRAALADHRAAAHPDAPPPGRRRGRPDTTG